MEDNNESGMHLWNVGERQCYYTPQYPRRLSASNLKLFFIFSILTFLQQCYKNSYLDNPALQTLVPQ
jgi:hypothetical protein